MKNCHQRAQLLDHFKNNPVAELSPALAEHLGTCPDCAKAVGKLLDSQMDQAAPRQGTRSRGDSLPPRARQLLDQARQKMRRELGISNH